PQSCRELAGQPSESGRPDPAPPSEGVRLAPATISKERPWAIPRSQASSEARLSGSSVSDPTSGFRPAAGQQWKESTAYAISQTRTVYLFIDATDTQPAWFARPLAMSDVI